MAVNAGSVYVDLGARLDRREFEAYDRELKKVQERVARREHFKTQLGGDFDPRAFRAYESELRRVERANDDHVKAAGRLRTAFGSVWARGGAAFAAVGGAYAVVTAVKSVTSAYAESQVSQQKLAAQLKAVGINYDAHAKQIDAVIQRTSKLAGLDDEDLQDAFTAIVRTTGKVNVGLKDMALVADIARARHMDVAKAGDLVAKVHAGNVGALRRLGIEFTKSTENVDKLKASNDKYTPAQLAAAKAADKSADSTKALGLLQDRFKGQAKAFGDTQQGAADRARVAWENLRENLGQKLAPMFTNVAGKLADFLNGIQDGTGSGGRFARRFNEDVLPAIKQVYGALKTGAHWVGVFFDHLNENERQVGGWVSGFGRAESTVLKFTGTLVGGKAGDRLKEWGKNVDRNADAVDRWRQELRITKEVDKIEADLDRLKNKTNGTLHGILTATHRNMDAIRDTMGEESAAGQRALHKNFQAAVTAIRTAMRQGNISTKTGLAQIRREMLQELRTLGIDSAQRGGLPLSKHAPKGDLPVTTNSAPVTKYGGGWIGAPGMVGPDVVPAMLAPGEAVLNRHQQAVIESMLGGGFLDRLFATVQRPHYMQRGGKARRFFARGGDTGGRFLQLPENISVTHQTAGLAGYPAQDIFASPGTPVGAPVGGTIARLSGQAGGPGGGGAFGYSIYENGANGRSYFLTHFGSTSVRPGQRVRRGDIIGTVADYPGGVPDHIHEGVHGGLTGISAGGGPQGAVRAAWRALRAPRSGIGGLLGQIVQGALDRTASLANQRGRALAATASGPGVPAGGPGGGSNQANRALGREMAADRGWTGAQFAALDRLWQGESGWSNTARNPSSGAFGIPQALPASKMGPAGAGGNPRAQIAWGLAYIAQRYGDPANAYRTWLGRSPHWYAQGGFAGAGGAAVGRAVAGRRGKLPRLVGNATAGLIRKTPATTVDNSSTFNAIMGRVDAIDADYARHERRFNISDEELVDADTGQLNTAAIQRKVKELTYLLIDRRTQEQELDTARAFARNLIRSYKRIVTALRRSLRHAKGKDRKGIRGYISTYDKRIGEWRSKVSELGDTIFDTHTDLLEVQGELSDVQSTQPNIPTPDVPDAPDTGTGDTGTGADASASDTTTAPPTAADIAAGVFQQLQTFQQGQVDLLSAFAPNAITQRQAYGPGGPFSGHPDAFGAALGGARFFGAGSSIGGSLGMGAGGPSVGVMNVNYATAPADAPTLMSQLRFQVENGGVG